MAHARHTPESNRRYYEAHKHERKSRAKRPVLPAVEDMTLEELIATQDKEPPWGFRSPIIGLYESDNVDPWDDPTFLAVLSGGGLNEGDASL